MTDKDLILKALDNLKMAILVQRDLYDTKWILIKQGQPERAEVFAEAAFELDGTVQSLERILNDMGVQLPWQKRFNEDAGENSL
jgi:hypothetical protein